MFHFNRMILLSMLVSLSALVLTGCAAGLGNADYSRDQTRTVEEVMMGTVTNVRNVNIEGTKTPIGALAGAAVGGIAGSQVGGGNGSAVGTVLGAVLGGVGGAAVEEKVTAQNGVEVTIKLDSGRMIAITQASGEPFNVGDRVRVLSGNGVTRVAH